ncbi:MAG: metallopeptidase family protein [Planctomycetota bacterium]
MHLSGKEFAELVREALAEVPPAFRHYLENIIVDVEPTPDSKMCRELEVDDPSELLGLYHGTPLTERGFDDPIALPDRITIYQRNIEGICESRKEIVDEIRTTVLHEIGHHFGLEEDDLDELGFA